MLPRVARRKIQWTVDLLIPMVDDDIDSPMVVVQRERRIQVDGVRRVVCRVSWIRA
jgi:hypothetical protein